MVLLYLFKYSCDYGFPEEFRLIRNLILPAETIYGIHLRFVEQKGFLVSPFQMLLPHCEHLYLSRFPLS